MHIHNIGVFMKKITDEDSYSLKIRDLPYSVKTKDGIQRGTYRFSTFHEARNTGSIAFHDVEDAHHAEYSGDLVDIIGSNKGIYFWLLDYSGKTLPKAFMDAYERKRLEIEELVGRYKHNPKEIASILDDMLVDLKIPEETRKHILLMKKLGYGYKKICKSAGGYDVDRYTVNRILEEERIRDEEKMQIEELKRSGINDPNSYIKRARLIGDMDFLTGDFVRLVGDEMIYCSAASEVSPKIVYPNGKIIPIHSDDRGRCLGLDIDGYNSPLTEVKEIFVKGSRAIFCTDGTQTMHVRDYKREDKLVTVDSSHILESYIKKHPKSYASDIFDKFYRELKQRRADRSDDITIVLVDHL